MSGFVIDASVAPAWCFDDGATDATSALSDRFADEQAAVPSLWHLELANALAVSERNQRITRADSREFIALIGRLPIVVDETTPSLALRTVLDLARSEGVSAYQASYLEPAIRRGAPLATKDDALAQAARRVGLSLLPTA